MSYYRTRTYIAGDWDGDKNLIDKLYEWNNSCYWSLHFTDAHDLTQARDTSKPCSIKKSLSTRLDASKTFVLIVGEKTATVTKGSCRWCGSYYNNRCYSGGSIDFRSFIEYECEKAKRDELKIIVIYNSLSIDKSKCPKILQNVGKHLPAYINDGGRKWNYTAIKNAIMD